MSKKIDKEDLKGPDVFVGTSDRVFAWVEKKAKVLVSIAVAVVVAVAGYMVVSYVQSVKEVSAAEALYVPEAELKKAEAALREGRGDQIKDLLKKDAKIPPPAVPDYARDYAPKVDALMGQLREHSGTKAAMISAMNLSYFLLQQKQFSQAMEVLTLVKYSPKSSDLLNGFWQMHRGLTLIENQQFDQALQAYQSIVKAKELSYFHPEALLKTGFTYEMKGDEAKARETYEKIGRDFPRTDAATTAQQYIRLMELKAQKS